MDAKEKFTGFFRWKHDLEKELLEGSQVIDTAKGPVEYALKGDEGGPLVAGVHGGPGGYDQNFVFLAPLLANGFRVLGWSRPGYLRTPLSSGATLDGQADLLAALLDALSIERVGVAGISAGGASTLNFAARHPERTWAVVPISGVSQQYGLLKKSQQAFARLMFNDPAMWLYDLSAHLSTKSTVKSFIKLESDLEEEQVEILLTHVLEDEAKVKAMLDLIKTMSPISLRWEGTKNDLEQLGAITSLPLEKIAAPTLVIHGKHDSDVPPAHAENTASRVPGAELMWVEDGFHILAMSDYADQVDARMVGFLREHAPA